MQKIEQKGYSKEQIMDALHGRYIPRIIGFKYDLLDKFERKKKTLQTITDCEVDMNSLANIKRTADIKLKDDIDIDWLNDRIQPFIMFKIGSDWVEWSQGIFLLNSPTNKEKNGNKYCEVECYDGLVILEDDKIDARYTIPIGTNYVTAIINLLIGASIKKYNIEQTDKTLPISKEWEPGTCKLAIINELLQEINYTSLWVDEYGFYTAAKYRLPNERTIEYSYKDDEQSIIFPGAEEKIDLFNVPNKWVVVQSNAEKEPLVSTYKNENPFSLTSYQNRGRWIVDYREINNIADQTSLDSYTKRIAYEASQVYGDVTFETAIMPFHSYMDALELMYKPLDICGNYIETSWNIKFEIGAHMKHKVRRVVQI